MKFKLKALALISLFPLLVAALVTYLDAWQGFLEVLGLFAGVIIFFVAFFACMFGIAMLENGEKKWGKEME